MKIRSQIALHVHMRNATRKQCSCSTPRVAHCLMALLLVSPLWLCAVRQSNAFNSKRSQHLADLAAPTTDRSRFLGAEQRFLVPLRSSYLGCWTGTFRTPQSIQQLNEMGLGDVFWCRLQALFRAHQWRSSSEIGRNLA